MRVLLLRVAVVRPFVLCHIFRLRQIITTTGVLLIIMKIFTNSNSTDVLLIIMNIIFNDYILNDAKYLEKYKQAVPKKKKRRDKSGINALKKDAEQMEKRRAEMKQRAAMQ